MLGFICRNLESCKMLLNSVAYTSMVRHSVECASPYETEKRINLLVQGSTEIAVYNNFINKTWLYLFAVTVQLIHYLLNVFVRCCIYLTTYDWIKSFLKITMKAEPYMEI